MGAPFFVFQVLCLLLWSLDDYWYYSVFTLFMLLVFEAMLCRQRQNSLYMLRNMRRPPHAIFIFRNHSWVLKSTEEIIPGDIISLTSTSLMGLCLSMCFMRLLLSCYFWLLLSGRQICEVWQTDWGFRSWGVGLP